MNQRRLLCYICGSYLRDHINLHEWRACTGCNYRELRSKMITAEMLTMGRDKLYPKDYTKEIEANLLSLADKVSLLLKQLGITTAGISSGWRPAAINSKIQNAAKKSTHMIGNAVDLKDHDGSLGHLILKNLDKLKSIGLYLEDPRWTHKVKQADGSEGNWIHLQQVPPKSGHRIFIPSADPASDPTFFDGKYDSKYD
jgi:hypothetical protein